MFENSWVRPLALEKGLAVAILEPAYALLARRMWEKALRNGSLRKEEVRVGTRLAHRAFGAGVVTRFKGDLVFVDFGADERSFHLQNACKKGLFLKII